MDSYYDEIVKQVRELIAQGDVKEAYAVLEDELSMPYIPKEYEDDMISLYNECRSTLQINKVERNYTDEDIAMLLMGSLDEQFMAVEMLKKSNLRNHLSEIETYLMQKPHFLVQSFLIEAMIEQGITDEMHMLYDELEVTFLPCYIEMPMDAKGANLAVLQLRDWLENDNPSFLTLCAETLIKEVYLRLPFNVDEDEATPLALAIVKYVFAAGGEKNAYEAFLVEKNLAQSDGFELLLDKHDI